MPVFNLRKTLLTLGIILGVFILLVVYEHFFADSIEEKKMAKISPETFNSYQAVQGILNIHTWENKNGVKVYFIAAPELPMVDIRLIFDAGSARDQINMPLAYLANTLLNQGTPKQSADDIANQFEMMGAQYNHAVFRDMAMVGLRSLTDGKNLEKSLALLADLVANPLYDKMSLKREKQQVISLLKYQGQTPEIIAERAFYEALYEKKPYGFWELGDEHSIDKVKAKDLINFHKTYYVRQNSVVIIVGNVSLVKANEISEELTEQLPVGMRASALDAVELPKKLRSKHINFQSSQTHIMYGMPVLTRQDKDYFPLIVGNHILGGNPQSNRLFDTIRGQHGLAYSVYSHFSPMQVAGPFMMVCQTKTEESKRVQETLQTMLSDFIEKGPTEAELEQAKLNILGGYPLKFDSNRNILIQLSVLAFYSLPLDYFDQYLHKVNSLTIDDIQDAFKRRVSPEKMAIITVGESK